jgi:hypothetical protein
MSTACSADPNPNSRRVWHFEDLATWKAEVLRLLEPIVDAAVIQEFCRRPPKYIVSDDLTWLDEIIARVHGIDPESKWFLSEQLRTRYDAIRAYHGARPVDVATYYNRGLEPMEAVRTEQQAREFFLSGRFPQIAPDDVERAIERVGRKLREGRIYFEASKRMLEDHCAHYMLYGSEFITGVAAGLWAQHGPDYRQELKTIGRPTVFVCDVPLCWMPEGWLEEYAGSALEALFESLLSPNYRHPPNGRGTGIMIQRPLPPENIVGHYHPARLVDPLLGRRVVEC